MRELSTRDEIWNTLRALRSWVPMSFSRKLIAAYDRGIVDSVYVSPNTSVEQARWDGVLLVGITDQARLQTVFDYIVTPCHAAEISMEQGRMIRLWWN